jgi:hypothetical protein
VEAALSRVSGRRGRHRLRRVLAACCPEDHELESEAERRFRALCRRYGLPNPHPQLIEGYRLDFYWPQARLAVEVDGAAFHHTRRAFHAEPDLDRGQKIAGELQRALAARTG